MKDKKRSRRHTEIPKSSSSKKESSSTADEDERKRHRRHTEIPRHNRRRRSSKEREKRSENGPEDESESRRRNSSDDNKKQSSRARGISRHKSTRRTSSSSDDEKEHHQKSKQKKSSSSHRKPRRRISIDDIAIDDHETLVRRKTNQSAHSSKSKDDLDMIRKEHRRKPSMDSDSKGHGAHKSSVENSSPGHKNNSVERKSSTGSNTTKRQSKSSSRRPRRQSIDDCAVYEYAKHNRRKSNESAATNKSKDDMDLFGKRSSSVERGQRHNRNSSVLSGSSGNRKSSVERKSSSATDKKKKRQSSSSSRRPRRGSIDDSAVYEHAKHNRRKSNESAATNKSKDDMDLFGSMEKKGDDGKSKSKKISILDDSIRVVDDRGEMGKRPDDLLHSNSKGEKKIPTKLFSDNLERFEELLQKSKEEEEEEIDDEVEMGDKDGDKSPKSRGDKKKAGPIKSKSCRPSIDSSNSHRGPKRRSLDKWDEDQDESEHDDNFKPELLRKSSWARRSSHGSEESGRRYASSSRRSSLQSSSCDSAEEGESSGRPKKKRPASSRTSSHSSLSEAVENALGGRGKEKSFKDIADSMVVATDGKAARRRTNSCDKMQALIGTSVEQDTSLEQNDDKDDETEDMKCDDKRRSSQSKKNLKARSISMRMGRGKSKNRAYRRASSDSSLNKTAEKALGRATNDDTNGSASKDAVQQHDENDEADKYKSDERRSSRPKKNLRRSLHRLSISNKADGLRSGSSRRSSRGGTLGGKKEKHPSTRMKRNSYDHSSASKRKSSRTSNTRRHDEESSSHGDEDVESRPKTEAGETTSELDSYLAKKRSSSRHRGRSSATRKSVHSRQSQSSKSSTPENQHPEQKRTTCCQRIKRRKWQCLCCCTVLILVFVAIVATLMVLRAYETSFTTNVEGEEISSAPSKRPSPLPSLSMIPTEAPTTMAPTPAPLSDISIVVIVQLDAKPEETGFSLTSADNSTTYVSYSSGDLAGMQGEVVMEVVTIIERTELVFTVTDESGDGLCCTYGSGYYKILAGSGDGKMQIISGEQSAKYVFAAGEKKMALQIGGVDPNEYCKPCPDGKDCGRCAWCDSDEGFLPDTVFHYQCKSQEPISIPKRCFVGEKRYKLHNQYISAMAGCSNGFEAGPQILSSPGTTICVEEAHCVKTFAFVQPNCEAELIGSLLVKETCQDLIGGLPFGYSWGLNAPREKECQSSQSSRDFAASLAQRCCVDGVSFCSTFKPEDSGKVSLEFDNDDTSTPMPAPGTTYAPTMSHPPTWDGYPITILLQLDKFPRETGLSITSVDKEITYFERIKGYYKKSQLVVEKVRIPLGIEVILTLTDKEGDGMQDGDGYIQVYSERGSIILDEEGIFSEVLSRNFIVGEPDTQPPTASVAPSMSMAPTFYQFPITIVLQLDQWSDETGFSIKTTDENEAFFDWPIGTFATQSAGLVKETVYLPSDAEAELKVTDAGGDGFCCLYGDGYVKIFAGLDTEDESNLIAFESGDFDSSELSITFRAGPAPTVSPATTLTPTTPKTKSEWTGLTRCDAFEMTLVLQLDKYSAETEWSIDSSDGLTNYFAREDGYYEEMKSEIAIETICLAEGYEYRFRIADFMGDGTCCWAGNGWYSLYEGKDIEDNSTQVFYGDGEFGRERIHVFVAGKPITPAPTTSRSPSEAPSGSPSAAPTDSSMPTVTTYAVEVTIALDSNSHETGWHIAKEDETVVIDRPPGYYTGNDTQSVVETIRLEAGDYTFTALDTAGNGFCCGGGVGFYSLYSNGESLLFRQGMFEYSYSETFTIAPKEPDIGTVAISKKSTPMLRGSDQYPNKPQRQRKHVDPNAFIDT